MRTLHVTVYKYWVASLPKIFAYSILILAVYSLKQLPYFNIFLPWSYCFLFIWIIGIVLFKPKYLVFVLINILTLFAGGIVQILTGNEIGSELVSAGYYMSAITLFIHLRRSA